MNISPFVFPHEFYIKSAVALVLSHIFITFHYLSIYGLSHWLWSWLYLYGRAAAQKDTFMSSAVHLSHVERGRVWESDPMRFFHGGKLSAI